MHTLEQNTGGIEVGVIPFKPQIQQKNLASQPKAIKQATGIFVDVTRQMKPTFPLLFARKTFIQNDGKVDFSPLSCNKADSAISLRDGVESGDLSIALFPGCFIQGRVRC